jgi:PAS domain S-box-containing protein
MFRMDFPVLKYYDLSMYTEDQLIDLSIPPYTEFLKAMSENKLDEHLAEAIRKWETNQLPNITRDQLVVADITLATYVRKKVLLSMIPSFTSDVNKVIELIQEIDDYILEAESRSFQTYIDIHQETISKINEVLAKHEEELLEAQKIAGLGSFEWDLIGTNSKYTPQVFSIFEMEKSSNLEDFLQYVHPGDREKVRNAINHALKTFSDYECEYRYRKHGHEKIIWSKGVVIEENGKASKIKGTIMDITERQYILQRLKRNDELYKQAQKLSHIGNWTWDLGNGQIRFSEELYRIYGIDPGVEITPESFISYVHPEDHEKAQKELKHTLETGEPHTLDFRIIRPDGSTCIVRRNVETLKDEKGVPYKITGTAQDITREVILLNEIKEREENFRQLIANAPDAIIVIDQDGRILLWNQKTTTLFGWEGHEIIDQYLTDTIIPARYRSFLKKGIESLSEKNALLLNKTIEMTANNKHGKEFFISLTISQSVQNGKPVFISFIRDISDEKRIKSELELKTNQLAELNLSLEQKNIALERSNKELTSFSYVASHDLQEPIRKIKSFSNQILETETNLSDEGRDCFNRIMQSAGRMQKLIEDLLSFSRTQIYEKTFSQVDLNQVLAEIENLHMELITGGRLKVEMQHLPVINAVKFQIQQLFENIVSNSIKYSRPDKAIELSITSERMSGKQVPFANANENQDYYKICISDNGIGFDQKYSEKIFEIFQRLHSRNEYSGTGIGLSICKKIVENHFGFIMAHGAVGEGATFEIYLPTA